MLNLKYPPPHAQWEEGEWSWKKLAEYLTAIKNGGIATTFDFYIEEYQLLTHAARNYGGQIVNSRKECGYRVPGMEASHNDVLMPIFGPNGTANNNWLYTDDERFKDFLAKPLQDPLTQPVFWKSWAFSTPYTVEFNSIFNGQHQRNIFHPVAYPNGVVGQALMPGKSTFLGGAGVAITVQSKKKDLGWKFIQMLASPTYQRLINQGLESPYTAVLESSREWSLPESDAVRMQFSKAVPPQYPQNAFTQSAELEARAPWRAYLVEMAYKNVSFPALIDRLCKVIDYVMLPICSAEHMSIQDKGCNPVTLTRNLTYVWDKAKPCRDGISLPNDIELTCPVVTGNSQMAVGVLATSGILIAVLVALMVVVWKYQEKPAIKKSSYVFSQLMLVGCIIAVIGIFFMPRTTNACGVETWLLAYGFIILMGSITLKMDRIIRIFNSKMNRIAGNELQDQYLLRKLGALFIAETILLLIYQFVDQPRLTSTTKTIVGTQITYVEEKCSTSNTVGATILLVCNVLMLLNGIRLAYATRTVPNQYNDGKVMGIMVYTMTLLLLVVFLGSLFVSDPRFSFLLTSVSTILIALSSAIVHTVPKLIQTLEEDTSKSAGTQNQSAFDAGRCKNCGFIDQSKPAVSQGQQLSTGKVLSSPTQ